MNKNVFVSDDALLQFQRPYPMENKLMVVYKLLQKYKEKAIECGKWFNMDKSMSAIYNLID